MPKGRKLEVVVLEAPSTVREEFASDDSAAEYINFYVCNGAVIAPEFGDPKTNLTAKQTLQQLFPERKIVQTNIDGIATGGGIHCTTQHLNHPFAGARILSKMLKREGILFGRRRVSTLMKRMGIHAIYRKPNTSKRY